MKTVWKNLRFWTVGVGLAVAGVILARLISGETSGAVRVGLTVAGQLLALTGLFVICVGVSRRLRRAAEKTNVLP